MSPYRPHPSPDVLSFVIEQSDESGLASSELVSGDSLAELVVSIQALGHAVTTRGDVLTITFAGSDSFSIRTARASG